MLFTYLPFSGAGYIPNEPRIRAPFLGFIFEPICDIIYMGKEALLMIGLTGGIASGKSTVTARLSSLGAFVADADKVSREIMSDPKVLSRIREEFGGSVFAEDGSLLRTELALRVFSSEARTQLLNSITHPAIAERLLEMASEAEKSGEYPLVFVDRIRLLQILRFGVACDGRYVPQDQADHGQGRPILR